MLADATGRSVIVEVTNGETKVIEKTGNYQIATNYLITAPHLAGSGGWDREKKVADILNTETFMTKEKIVEALQGCSQGSKDIGTIYSNIVDLKNMILDLYLYNDPSIAVRIDLLKELKKNAIDVNIEELFLPGGEPKLGQFIVNDVTRF